MSPWWRMPPSAMIGLVATRAHHFSADSCQPPVPKPVFSFVMQTLPGPTPTLVASAPQFSRSMTASGVATLPAIDEGLGQLAPDVLDGLAHAVRMAVRNVDGDVVGADALGRQAVDRREIRGLDAGTDRHEQALVAHATRVGDVVQVEAVHHVEVAVRREPLRDRLVDHRLHVGRHDRQLEAAAARTRPRVAFAAAVDAALARQQQDVVVVEDFHRRKVCRPHDAAGGGTPFSSPCVKEVSKSLAR